MLIARVFSTRLSAGRLRWQSKANRWNNLRALAHDAHIQIELAPEAVPAGVDTESDLAAVRALLGAEQ